MMIVARSILCFQSSLNTLAKAPKAASVYTDTQFYHWAVGRTCLKLHFLLV